MSDLEKDLQTYNRYLELWQSENPIKTNKLQVLLVVNGLLVSALQLAGGFTPDNWFLFVAGGVFSFIWVLSLGRTSYFQKIWQAELRKISGKPEYADDPRFHILDTDESGKLAPAWLRLLGCMPSKYYLLGAPVLFSLMWFIALIYVVVAK